MKTLIITIILTIWTCPNILDTPPKVVNQTFKEKFPSAKNIIWAKRDKFVWEVNFNLNEKKVYACFYIDGHWILTRMNISITDLREDIKTSIMEYYPNCEIKTIERTENIGSGIYYDIKFKCGDKETNEIFDSNGLRIRI